MHALTRHWRDHPPTHVLVAAYLGHKPPSEAIRLDASTEATGDLAEALKGMPITTAPALDDRAWRAAMNKELA